MLEGSLFVSCEGAYGCVIEIKVRLLIFPVASELLQPDDE